MAKKAAASTLKQNTKQAHTYLRGLFIFCLSIILLLSLLSFAIGPDVHSWIGIIGFFLGKIFHSMFGLGSYFLCFYLGWIGWRRLFCKPINHSRIKAFCLWVFVRSLCILLSLLE